jgi:hypothetical protein
MEEYVELYCCDAHFSNLLPIIVNNPDISSNETTDNEYDSDIVN